MGDVPCPYRSGLPHGDNHAISWEKEMNPDREQNNEDLSQFKPKYLLNGSHDTDREQKLLREIEQLKARLEEKVHLECLMLAASYQNQIDSWERWGRTIRESHPGLTEGMPDIEGEP